MMSTEDFLPSRRKGLLQHAVDNEVSALVRLTFYENRSVLIEQETSVRYSHQQVSLLQCDQENT